jgi:hypothetical protein
MLGRLVVASVSILLLTLGLASAPATAQAATSLTLTASRGHADSPTKLRVTLDDGGTPFVGTVVLDRRVGGVWSPVATVTTDGEGNAAAQATLAKRAADNVFRARFAGDGTHGAASSGPQKARLIRRESVVVIGGPTSVVDGRRTVVRVRWRTESGLPVSGKVSVFQRLGDRRWHRVRTVRTDAEGKAALRVRPRVDSRWRATVRKRDWVTGDRSRVHRIDNLPPGERVRLPRAAPSPRVGVPPQQRATGDGAHAVVTRIPAGVWRQMTGRSWHRGCPVGRAGLRLVRVNYWGYDGYRYRGEVVAAASAAPKMAGALAEMYAKRFPIRSMYRVDRFGWSAKLHGANDYKSMAAGNTSAFNCRQVVNRPGVRSPHSYGRSLDLNTWENPYRSPTGLVPNSWWQRHSHPLVAWRSRAHPVVRIMARHGLRWTYGMGDTQHFDATGDHGRVMVYPGCEDVVCD